jgi:zinc protease
MTTRPSPLLLALLMACATAPKPVAEPVAAAPVPAPILATPDAPFRAQKPAPLDHEPAFDAPVPQSSKLKNGAKLLVVENHAVPLVSVDIVVLAGSDAEPLDRPGLAGLVSSMMLEGTKSRTAIELDIARERLGAQLSVGSSANTTTLHLNALKETLPEALALVADVLLNPAWRPEDLERVRGLALTGLEQKKGNPSALARDQFNRLVWGPKNPWGQPSGGTPKSLKAMARKDLSAFHQRWFVPNNALVSVSGDVTPDEIRGLLEKTLSGWKAKPVPKIKVAPFPKASPRAVFISDLPQASQSQVWVGWRGVKATSDEVLPLLIGNNILGGLFTSRLNLNLREQKAFSYGVRSRVVLYRDTGTILAAGGIIAQHTAEAVVEFEKELVRLRDAELGSEELARAKEAIIRGIPSSLETNDAVSAAMAWVDAVGLPLDYYATLAARTAAVEPPLVTKAIRALVLPDIWPVIVVGPKSQSEDQLRKLGLGDVTVLPAN